MRHIKEIMIVAVCLMVLSFCVCTGFGIYFMYREGVQEYEDLRTYVKETDEDDHTEGTDGSDGKQTVVDFKALKKINPDIVAWIRIPDTSIDYPVVQGNDDSYYLTHTFKKTEHVAGAIFLDSDNNADFSDDKNIIYGHNMKNGTMFSDVTQYRNKGYYTEHPVIEFETAQGLKRYAVFAVAQVKNNDEWYAFHIAADESEYDTKIAEIKSRSLYGTEITPIYGQQLITLSTCYGATKSDRIIVVGVEIQE